MIENLLWFVLGGYLIPAAFFAANTWAVDRKAEDNPSVLESLMTAIVSGAIWPLAEHTTEFRR